MFHFDLSQDIHQYLQSHPLTKELDIIRHLQKINRLPMDVLRSDLSMFRAHFLVFNGLYRLRKQGHDKQTFHLEISALSIQLMPYESSNSQSPNESDVHSVRSTDPLYFFYTDLQQLNQTTTHDVRRLLDLFWQRYIAPEQISDQQKLAALSELELSDPVDFNTIKQQYRRLAMRHHPDRGGDQDKLVSINQAMQCLEVYYSR